MPDSPVADIPDISVIVITCNSEKFLRSCLDSIFKQEFKALEIILVDNGSQDRTTDIVKEGFPGITLIENAVNLGAAEARNQGIELAKGKWILVLDCDTVIEDNFFFNIINSIGSLPYRVGMLQPKILNPDKKTIYSCGIYLSWSRRFYDIGSQRFDRGQFNRPRRILGPCSAAALYRRKMLDELKEDTGYFDRRFFFLVEDVDLAWRAQRGDWKCLLVPEAVCYHGGNSSCFDAKRRRSLSLRNRYLTIRKNEGILRYSLKVLPLVLYDLPRFCFLFLANCFAGKSSFKETTYKNEALK